MPVQKKVQTFGQYLVNKILPPGIEVTKPITKSVMEDILTEVYRNHPDKYNEVVTSIKSLGDRFSSFEGITFGMNEIQVPNKTERDRLIKNYTVKLKKAKGYEAKVKVLGEAQNALVDLDRKSTASDDKDSASMLVYRSGALGGKKNQLVKLRTTPVVVAGKDGGVVPDIFGKSYAEGQDPYHHWLQAIESRNNVVTGKTQTASPGELSKIIHNVVAESVVSMEDCGTKHGIPLNPSDDIVGRYVPYQQYGISPNRPITDEDKKELVHRNVKTIIVRSPQTCEAHGNTVCAKCMGLGISTMKPFSVGEHAGFITAGNLAEPLTQMVLSAKHSTSMAKLDTSLRGDTGFRQLVNFPKEYPNRKVYCEVYGTVSQILPSPQGGKMIVINTSGSPMVPKRFVVNGLPYPKAGKSYLYYYVPPNRNIIKSIKPNTKVYPGMELTDGVDNLQDISRLKGIGITRSTAAEEMRNVYRNTGVTIDRRHFELLGRAAHNNIKIEKAPRGFRYHRGEVIEYPEFAKAAESIQGTNMPVDSALNYTTLKQYNDVTIGTKLTPDIIQYLKELGVKDVYVTDKLETSVVTVALERVVNQSRDWLPKLNHRYLKQTITEGAAEGAKSDIHSYNPYTSYAVGTEIKSGDKGEY